MNNIEMYILCNKRTYKTAINFLNEFTPKRTELSDEYRFPEYSENPSYILKKEKDILKLLEKEKNELYSIYWKGYGDISQSMIFFTKDNAMIVGQKQNIAITIGYNGYIVGANPTGSVK